MALNAAGMITLVSGILLGSATLLAPSYGAIAISRKRRALKQQMAEEDLLSDLFRLEENPDRKLFIRNSESNTRQKLISRGLLEIKNNSLALTALGRDKAKQLIRSHRLWESYLVSEAGVEAGHVHTSAEKLEHYTASTMQKRLAENLDFPSNDPHGKDIPSSDTDED